MEYLILKRDTTVGRLHTVTGKRVATHPRLTGLLKSYPARALPGILLMRLPLFPDQVVLP